MGRQHSKLRLCNANRSPYSRQAPDLLVGYQYKMGDVIDVSLNGDDALFTYQSSCTVDLTACQACVFRVEWRANATAECTSVTDCNTVSVNEWQALPERYYQPEPYNLRVINIADDGAANLVNTFVSTSSRIRIKINVINDDRSVLDWFPLTVTTISECN